MELIKEKPEYGNIICRCEMVTEGEIMDAINRPLGRQISGRGKTQNKSRNGTMSGWILFTENDGDPGERTPCEYVRDHKIRWRF